MMAKKILESCILSQPLAYDVSVDTSAYGIGVTLFSGGHQGLLHLTPGRFDLMSLVLVHLVRHRR